MPDTPPKVPRAYERYMMFAAVAGNAIFFIQSAKIFSTQSAADVSLWAFMTSVWALSSWLLYGILLRNRILIWANVVGVSGALLVVAGKLIYG